MKEKINTIKKYLLFFVYDRSNSSKKLNELIATYRKASYQVDRIDKHQWRIQGGGAVGAAAPPLKLMYTALIYLLCSVKGIETYDMQFRLIFNRVVLELLYKRFERSRTMFIYMYSPNSAIDDYVRCNSTFFPNIKVLLQIHATLSVTTVTGE